MLRMNTRLCYDKEIEISRFCTAVYSLSGQDSKIKTLIAFILGLKNLQTSLFRDHAVGDVHHHAITLNKKSKSSVDVSDYAPIAKALTNGQYKIVYFLAKETYHLAIKMADGATLHFVYILIVWFNRLHVRTNF